MYDARYVSVTCWCPRARDKKSLSWYIQGVWHEALLIKLKQNGISGNLLNVIIDFLYQRKQRVVLNGQHSSWTNVQAGVPQRSILGPLFFLIYINDLSDGLTLSTKLFADDASLFSVVQNINSKANGLNSDLMKTND